MRVNDVTAARLRDLAGRRPERGKVITLFVNLDPSQFGTVPARSSEITSLLDAAHRQVERAQLGHDEKASLRADLQRVGEVLPPDALPDGAEGLAVIASGTADLLEVFRLPRPVPSRVFIEDAPHIAPLVGMGAPEPWCVALVTRGNARFLLGPPEGLVEERVGDFRREEYEREDPTSAGRHLRRVAETLERLLQDGRYVRLLAGVPKDLRGQFEELLHPDVRARLVRILDCDAEHVPVADVSARASEIALELRRQEAEELLGRLDARVARGDGRATVGLPATLEALHERRVEALLLAYNFAAPGTRCPRCGRLGADLGEERCPADQALLARRDDVVDDAIACAVEQDARVLRLADGGRLPQGVAAVLRF
jgi:peptide chain release factor subunit 1